MSEHTFEQELAGKTTAELAAILVETDARLAELTVDNEPVVN